MYSGEINVQILYCSYINQMRNILHNVLIRYLTLYNIMHYILQTSNIYIYICMYVYLHITNSSDQILSMITYEKVVLMIYAFFFINNFFS